MGTDVTSDVISHLTNLSQHQEGLHLKLKDLLQLDLRQLQDLHGLSADDTQVNVYECPAATQNGRQGARATATTCQRKQSLSGTVMGCVAPILVPQSSCSWSPHWQDTRCRLLVGRLTHAPLLE